MQSEWTETCELFKQISDKKTVSPDLEFVNQVHAIVNACLKRQSKRPTSAEVLILEVINLFRFSKCGRKGTISLIMMNHNSITFNHC